MAIITGKNGINNTLNGTALADTITGGNLGDTLNGLAGDDSLDGGAGNDTLNGGAGNDVLNGGAGNDVLNGGAGIYDMADYRTAAAGVTVNLNLTTAQNTVGAGTDTLAGIEGVLGSSFNDTLTGNATDNWLSGNAGNDTLSGGTGNDILSGDAGNDVLNGGAGIDAVDYWTATTGVTVNLNLTTAQNTVGAGTDTLAGIEGVLGSSFNDTLTGNAADNWLSGNAGNDTLSGGTGNDILSGDAGNDVLNGGAGIDTADYWTATVGVTVNLNLTMAQNTVGAGIDTLTGIEDVWGGGFNDTLTGNAANNWLAGDTGNDRLIGGGGSDTLEGGLGKDTLTGGVGSDTFIFSTAAESTVGLSDIITDFSRGADKIDLSAIDAKAATATVNDAFTFVNGSSFTAAGQVKFVGGALYGNTDANTATAEFAIAMPGVSTLASTDFIL